MPVVLMSSTLVFMCDLPINPSVEDIGTQVNLNYILYIIYGDIFISLYNYNNICEYAVI